MRPPHNHRPGSRGFTLLEVLIAFVIAALAIGVMIDGIVGGLRSASTAAHTQQAVALARSRLAAASAAIIAGVPPQANQSGDDGAFRWQVSMTAAGSASLPRPDAPPGQTVQGPRATLYAIKVLVSWKLDGAARQVRLDGASVGLSAAKSAGS